MVKNEGKYIEEWMEHYISQGVEHFYIIDNGSTDNTIEVLNKYNDIVTLFNDTRQYPQKQETMMNDHFLSVIKKSRWTMIVDADELMFGKYNKTVRQHLENVANNISCIYVIWKMYYGKEDSVEKMKDIKTRFNYDHLNKFDMNLKYFMMFGKSIFRPDRLKIPLIRVHKQVMNGDTIDNFNIVHKVFPDTIRKNCKHINEESLNSSPLHLNHYFIKTKKEYDKRMSSEMYDTITNPIIGERKVSTGWDYLKFLKQLYNLGDEHVIRED
jgi:glycosyltransferase involved in cell wall biosynthesis